MASTTASVICTGALGLVGAIDPEDLVVSGMSSMLNDAFRRLNLMMGQWSLQEFTIPVEARSRFPVVSGQGGPGNPYTVGIGGNLNILRPSELTGLGLILGLPAFPNETEIPRALLTRAAYEQLAMKDLPNTLFTSGYYSPTFAGQLGSLFLYPVPTDITTQIVLYYRSQLGPFASLTATYDLPDGAEEPIEYNLARRLLGIYPVVSQRTPDILDIARSSLAIYKRAYTPISDQPVDQMFTPNNRRGGYNINTGNQ